MEFDLSTPTDDLTQQAPRKTGYRWRSEHGGRPPERLAERARSGRYLSLLERQRIATLRERGLGVRQIADRLGRAPSTVSRELRRNTLAHDRGVYDAAHIFTYERAHETLAVALLVIGQRFVGGYLNGIDPRLRDIDATALMLREYLDLTARLDRPVYSMFRGTEPYKRQLAPRAVPNSRLLISGSRRWSSAAYAALVLGRIHAIRLMRTRFPLALDLVRSARNASSRLWVRGR